MNKMPMWLLLKKLGFIFKSLLDSREANLAQQLA